MAGDTDNARIWLGADVYVADVGSTAPVDVTTPFGEDWSPLGLLSEDGMEEARDQESNDYFAWGGIHTRTEDTKHKVTFSVAALEDTDVVWELVNPGSTSETAGGLTTRNYTRPRSVKKAVAFELRDGDITSRLILPVCTITPGNKSYGDTEQSARELVITPLGTDWAVEITNDPQAASA